MNMCTKFQVTVFENCWVLPFWMPQNATFYTAVLRYYFCIFPVLNFLSNLGLSKLVLGSFLHFCQKSDRKHASHHWNSKFWIWAFLTLWPGMIFTRSKVHKSLRGVSQTRSMSFNWLYFNMAWLLCPAKPARSENQEFYICADRWCH